MSWLEEHIETFVEPHLRDACPREPLGYFTYEELTVIKNTWRSVKRAANGKPVLLPGRDVFIFEILARREGYPTLFKPECSRMTVRSMNIPNLEEYFLFDTGFAGSIPRNLGMEAFQLMSYCNRDAVGVQVFPRLTFSRGLALRIESTPKYWQSGRMNDEEIVQPISGSFEFLQAARLTIEVYKNSSPKFIKSHQPIGKGRGRWE